MQPGLETLTEKKLIGRRLNMSYSENKTVELWRALMPRRREVKNNVGAELYSVEVYEPDFFDDFAPHRKFEKWAAIEVTDFETVPADMETLTIPEGLYSVFLHKGTAAEGIKTYQYIFEVWLPESDFLVDDRAHFAVMGEKYKQDDPASEEEIWIPVKPKSGK